MMKKICLILSLVLALSMLGACKTTSTTENPSSDSDLISSQVEGTDDGSSEEETEEPFDDGDDLIDDDPLDDEEPVEDPYADVWVHDLKVHNSEDPISTRYRGMSATIYHAFGFMEDEESGRVYTKKMMDTELDRLENTGIRYARTRFPSDWMWNNSTGWDYTRPRFGYFCNYANALQERDVSVVLQVGWHLGHITRMDNYSIADISYLSGDGADRYGESVGHESDLAGKSAEDQRMLKGAYRYGYWLSKTMRELRARGINNVDYFSYWVEPSNGYSGSADGHANREYVMICDALIEKLGEEGIADTVQHVGPNEVSNTGDSLLKYCVDNAPDLFDVYSCHFYPKITLSHNDVLYEIVKDGYSSYQNHMKSAGIWGKKEFWVDEFDVSIEGANSQVGDPWKGLQVAVGGIIAQQLGIDNVLYWQLFDQLWTDNTSDGGEWSNGIHITGCIPSLFESAIPQEEYYTQSLFMRYNGYKNGTVYRTNVEDLANEFTSMYVGAVQLEDGSWTITVINLNTDDATFTVTFDEKINQTLYRHLEGATTVAPNAEAKLADADKTYVKVADKFIDTIPGGSIAVYTGVKG